MNRFLRPAVAVLLALVGLLHPCVVAAGNPGSVLGNVGPTIALTPDPLYFYLTSGAVPVDPSATVSDPDSTDMNGGTLTVTLASPDPGVTLSISSGAGFTVSGSSIKIGATTIGIFSFDTENSQLVVSFVSTSATLAIVQAVVRAVRYHNTTGTAPQTQTLNFVLTDGDGGTSTVSSKTVEIVSNVGAPLGGAGNFALRAYPNPFTTRTVLLLDGRARGPAQVSVFNVLGQEVRRWDLTREGSSPTQLTWDGTGRDGRRLPAGRYFIRALGGDSNMRGSVILLK